MKKIINLGIRVAIALIYIYGGFIFFKINYNDHQKIETLKASGISAEAVVKEMKMTDDGICPYAEFVTVSNHTGNVTGNSNSSYNVGDVVMVKYNPENLDEAAIESDLNSNTFNFNKSVFGSALFCAICFLVAVFTLFSKKFRFQV
ncbi:DUF3592 domain-containing protein [Chondrinema litorale]|uniref:DUF3592 domain-containing protein n=1 Tax=Chondrinema litorale TaxID=2994555 RepID=UPI002543B88B|nr:DUF3592 domain-containing protein [Chondrinema litorale]UZR95887.1 hypothetical protein OQ292_08680 [Chondrinema litorale]